jgi:hypothetical protein
MKLVCAIALGFVSILSLVAQDLSDALVTTTVAREARFEIVQTPWNQNITFRLDKYRGVIDRLGNCLKDDSYGSNKCWKEMVVVDPLKLASLTRARFQIVMNSFHKTTFLIDTDTGASWQWGLEATEKWFPFIDCTEKTNAQCLWRPLP